MAKILIIDDENQIRLMLRQMFEREGYDILEAADGKQALKMNKSNPADLIITDIIMPEMEGIRTIMELKKEKPDAKIIAVSGGGKNSPEQYLHFAKKLGADRTFTKPFNRDELVAAVKEILVQ
jgi:DNA-binding response OmpR family regulator